MDVNTKSEWNKIGWSVKNEYFKGCCRSRYELRTEWDGDMLECEEWLFKG
jgi:hypothetical protein